MSVHIPHIGEKSGADGTLTDEKTGAYLKRTLEALVAWTHVTSKFRRIGG